MARGIPTHDKVEVPGFSVGGIMSGAASVMRTGSLERAKGPDPKRLNGNHTSPLAFTSLLFLFFIMYVAPQALIPELESLHLAQVSAILALVTSGKKIISQGRRLIVLNQEVKLTVWLVVLAVLSIPFSKWPGGSWASFTDQYSKSVIVFFLVAILLDSLKQLQRFLWAIAIFTAFNAVVGIHEYLAGSFNSAFERIRGGVSGMTSNPNDLALVSNLAIPFVGYLYVTSKARLAKMLSAGIIAVSVAAIIITYSRGGFLALIALLLWFVYVKSMRQGPGAFIRHIAMVFALLLMLFAFGPEGYSQRILSTYDTSKDYTGSAQERSKAMIGTAQSMIEHPLGSGLNMHNLLLHETGLGWAGVHNVYLQYAADLGIIGGILFLVILLKLLASMRRIRLSTAEADRPVAPLAGATEAALIAFAVAAFFLPVAYNFNFYIIAGLAVAVKGLARHTVQEHVGPSIQQRWNPVMSRLKRE